MNKILEWLLGVDTGEFAGASGWDLSLVSELPQLVSLGLVALFLLLVELTVQMYSREGEGRLKGEGPMLAVRIGSLLGLMMVLLFGGRLSEVIGNIGTAALLILLFAIWVAALVMRLVTAKMRAPVWARLLLVGARVGVFFLILLILLRPALVFKLTRTLYSTVVVLIDDSKSMSFTDRYGENTKIRDALAGELEVTPEVLTTMSRSEITRAMLLKEGGALEKLAKDHPLVLMQFSTTEPGKEAYTRLLGPEINVIDVPDEQRGETFRTELATRLDQLGADGFETNLPAALRDAVGRHRGRRIGGIVFISDGQNTSRDAARRWGEVLSFADDVKFPRYSVLTGDTTEPKNSTLASLRGPREVRRESQVEFSAILAHRNLGGRTVDVKLYRRKEGEAIDKNQLVATRSITFKEGERKNGKVEDTAVQTEILTLDEAENQDLGTFVYTAVVDSGLDEKNKADNRAEAVLNVSDNKIRVLLVSGYASWEFQYLRNFLLRNPDTFRVSVWQQNADKEINQSASTGMKLEHLPENAKELLGATNKEEQEEYPGYDVVILIDPRPEEKGFDANFAKLLRQFVENHSGGLCFLAGSKWTEKTLGEETQGFKPMRALLPVRVAKSTSEIIARIRGEKPEDWQLQVTSYGLEHPIMKIGATTDETKELWNIMPGLFWSKSVFDAKPAAQVLAEHTDPQRRTEENKPEPLIAVQPFGKGKVVYMGFHETWRWRFVRDGFYHREYWGNLIRYLATLKARQVVIATGREQFAAGERMKIQVEAYDENYNPLETPDGKFVVDMIDTASGDVTELELEAKEGEKGRYEKEIPLTRTGTYELTAMRDDPDQADKVAGKRITVELPKAEAARTEANSGSLEMIATRDVNFMNITELDQLAGRIPPGRLETVQKVPRELWDSNLMLLVVVLLLVVEWIFRKKYNMA